MIDGDTGDSCQSPRHKGCEYCEAMCKECGNVHVSEPGMTCDDCQEELEEEEI